MTLGPAPVLAVRLGGDTGAVGDQQSHCAGGIVTGPRSHSHTDSSAPGGVRVGSIILALVGMRAHVALQLCGRLTLNAAQLAQQHATGACPAKNPPHSAAVLPLLTVVFLSMYTQVGERGEAWRTDTQLKTWLPTVTGVIFETKVNKRLR